MSNYQNKNIKEFAKLFKALSNPNRLEIFMNLVSCCTPGVTGIQSSMDDAGCSCVGDLGKDQGWQAMHIFTTEPCGQVTLA